MTFRFACDTPILVILNLPHPHKKALRILFWSDTLPGNFAVWASTEEARFLHGRFVWCNWDVEEMKGMKDFDHPGFCRIGLQGIKPLSVPELFTQMTEFTKRT